MIHNKLPFVSIIIPTLNQEKKIRRLLSSIEQLEYTNFETIIVDASEDNTSRLAAKYNTTVFKVEKLGLNYARNKGIQESKGEIICFTDGDCVVPRNWLREIVKAFSKDSRIACVGGSVILKGKHFLETYQSSSPFSVYPIYTREIILRDENQLRASNVFKDIRLPVGSNISFRKSTILKLNRFDESWHSAWDESELIFRLLKEGSWIFMSHKISVNNYGIDSLIDLVRKVRRYGIGARKFHDQCSSIIFKSRLRDLPRTYIDGQLKYQKQFANNKEYEFIIFGILDIVVGLSYFSGFLFEDFKKSWVHAEST